MDGRIRSRTVVNASRYNGFSGVVNRSGHEMRTRIRRIDDCLRLGKLNNALLQITQRTLDEDFLFLIEVQQVVPECLLNWKDSESVHHTLRLHFQKISSS